jgi:uncharacterized protein YoxC
MKVKSHIAVWIILLAGGFLLGFVPQYLKNRDLQKELETPQKTIDGLTLQVQMSDIRDAASLMLVELSRQNYGLARDYSVQFYSKLEQAAQSVPDANLKKSLEELASTRDSVSKTLAAADSGSLAVVQPVVLRAFELTKR